ncbi:hypothetical protein [Faecalibacillus intestinalis]|uniref:hypothetical protein n=1 Tax=Faecalibacillus intestinalis TaxID=1982626 RepID=UPI003AB7FB83
MPFLIDMIYDLNTPCDFFDIELSKGDILNYYTQFLSLFATSILGVIAVFQTYKGQKKTDEINQLQLSIARRELAMAEKQYHEKQIVNKMLPKFDIKLNGYRGVYCDLNLSIKNVSDISVYSFTSISFDVYRDGKKVEYPMRWKIKFQTLMKNEKQNCEFMTPNMQDESSGKRICWENVELLWKFSCEIDTSEKVFFAAKLLVKDTNDINEDYWCVERIG